MTPLSQSFHRRSLAFALVALLFGIVAASLGLSMPFRPPSEAILIRAIVTCVVGLVVCFRATVNLIRDVDRGYPPGRCSLAVFLLFAFALCALPVLVLIILYSGSEVQR